MLRGSRAVILCFVSSLFFAGQSSAQGPSAIGPEADTNILSPKLCFTLRIPGQWKPWETPGSWISLDRMQAVRVTALDVQDLKKSKGNTLIEKEGKHLEQIHEKLFYKKLKGVTLARFESAVPDTWKWSAAPVRHRKEYVPIVARYLVDLSPEGIIAIEIQGAPDEDAFARMILATLETSRTQPCKLPRSIEDLQEFAKGISELPGDSKSAPSIPIDEERPTRRFQNPLLPWSVKYPENWRIDTHDPRRVSVTRPGIGVATSCEIMSVPVQFNALDEFADFWLRQTAEHMASQGGHVRRTDRQRITLANGIEALDVRSELPGGGRGRTVFALVDGVGYVFDCVTSVNSWESVAPVFAKIVGSFTIEKKQ